MPRINPVELNQAEGRTKAQLEGIQKAMGAAPNILRTLARSPAALDAYLGFSKGLGGGSLSPQLREQSGFTVARINGWD